MLFAGRGLSKRNAIREYVPELERARAFREKSLQEAKDDSMNRLMKDLAVDRANNPEAASRDQWNPEDEDEDEDDDDGDINIIDRSKFTSIRPSTPARS
jgi:GPN-loop GTPase